jgi:transposase
MRLASTHADWLLGFEDEVWWSRVKQPSLQAWTADTPLRLVEQAVAKDDPDPKALAAYGLLVQESSGAAAEVWLRFVADRPVSAATTAFLGWCCDEVAARGKQALLLVWDNASWHYSKEVQQWRREHNRTVKRAGCGARLLVCFLPSKSPWLNPIEPHWVHGKRRVAEPARLLSADELERRVCAAYQASRHERISITKNAA